jgi:GT2 family glycosyltransferase
MPPKVTLIWLNYNSKHFMSLALKSLESLFELNYPNYEVVIVDNHSTDGSFDEIKNAAEKHMHRVPTKIIRTEKNLGFTGGNNVGFKARDKDSKYVVLVNNDFILDPNYLEIIEWMESEKRVGAAQGITLTPRGALESYGIILDEMLAGHGLPPHTNPRTIKTPLTVTYVLGACAVYNVRAVLDAWRGAEKLFFNWAFGYFDDAVLALQLWNAGWKSRAYPIIAGKHFESRSFGLVNPFKIYLNVRNLIILGKITNSRYKEMIPILAIRYAISILKRYIVKYKNYQVTRVVYDAFSDACRISNKLIKKRFSLNLYCAPIIKLNAKDVLEMFIIRRKVVSKINNYIAEMYRCASSKYEQCPQLQQLLRTGGGDAF